MFRVIVLGNVFHDPNNTRKTFLIIQKTWVQVGGDRRNKNWRKWGKVAETVGEKRQQLQGERLHFSHPHLQVLVQKEAWQRRPGGWEGAVLNQVQGALNPHKVKKKENWLHSHDSLSPML